ncbi:palmitoyltransferase ZDHHC11-like [Acropora millepora]|uniref:palmitoyltransferase ZDHHC11-like n=1 Tax=Acropora millepora TaxID=45264 RepID=UPI001CF2CAC7|nr:palmitoyltransferase ZDHHC11-like [Acropora millepora]
MTPVHGADGTATSSRASSSAVLNQRERINGWSWPPHPLQFVAWFFLIFFSVFYFGVIVFYLPEHWQAAGIIIPGGFCGIHITYHILALTIDPADPNIRGGSKKGKGLFDRSKHRHVIVNSHCHICQTDVGSKSKHCSVCNKCVSDFDHHCKWLNNCVGGQNYRLFIGCISSAFVLALLVFIVTLYIFVIYFTSKDELKSLTDGKLKLFAAVPKDVIFITFLGIMLGLLLLTIALLGHLLGFHIYLMYHKMSTYEFVVSSRDRRSESSDVEAGAKSPANKKRFKNKVKPEQGTEESPEPARIEISDHERTSEDSLPNETTVKFINEVSSKVAAKQSKSNYDQETLQQQDSIAGATPGIQQYPSHWSPECDATSEESLKAISPSTTPGILLHQPGGSFGVGASTQQNFTNSSSQYGDYTSSAQRKSTTVTFHAETEEIFPSPRRAKSKKACKSEDTETLNSEDHELNSMNSEDVPRQGLSTGDFSTAKKKKKNKRKTTTATLRPIVARRPLPQLKLDEAIS